MTKITISSRKIEELANLLASPSSKNEMDHLTDQVFIGYSMEILSDEELKQINEHLETCSACTEKLISFLKRSNTWLNKHSKHRLNNLKDELLQNSIDQIRPQPTLYQVFINILRKLWRNEVICESCGNVSNASDEFCVDCGNNLTKHTQVARQNSRKVWVLVGVSLGLICALPTYLFFAYLGPPNLNIRVAMLYESPTPQRTILSGTSLPLTIQSTQTASISPSQIPEIPTSSQIPSIATTLMPGTPTLYGYPYPEYKKMATPTKLSTEYITEVIFNNSGLRAGPGFMYPKLELLQKGMPLIVYGKNQDGRWLSVITPGNQKGWVNIIQVETEFELEKLPVIIFSPTITP